jgi:hypothetical protein
MSKVDQEWRRDMTQHIPLIPMGTDVHGSAWLRNLAKANQHTVRLSVNAFNFSR